MNLFSDSRRMKKNSGNSVIVALLLLLLGLIGFANCVTNVHQLDPSCLRVPPVCGPPECPLFPPCIEPVGLPPTLASPQATGRLTIVENIDANTALFNIQLSGMNPNATVTAFLSYQSPGQPPRHPLFAPLEDFSDPANFFPGANSVAGTSIPLAPIGSSYFEGLGVEPNAIEITPDGNGNLVVQLNFNPLVANQGPLRNGMIFNTQERAPEFGPSSVAFQPPFEEGPFFPPLNATVGPFHQWIGASFLRKFDPLTGRQMMKCTMQAGRKVCKPEILRSPVNVQNVVIASHIDGTDVDTGEWVAGGRHGGTLGISMFPFPGVPANSGGHYAIFLFDLTSVAH